MRQHAAASLLYQSQNAESAFRNLQKLIFLKFVGQILAFYNLEGRILFDKAYEVVELRVPYVRIQTSIALCGSTCAPERDIMPEKKGLLLFVGFRNRFSKYTCNYVPE